MTCIVAVPDGEGGVVVGGDSAAVGGWYLRTRADAKVFERGPFVMGFTTSFRMGQVLRYQLDVPPQMDDQDDAEFMSTTFVDAVRSCLDEAGWRKKENDREEGGTFLVGYRGTVYEVQADFQVGSYLSGVGACGCGREAALGALHATEGRPPAERVRTALEAAEALSAGVRRPFNFVRGGR